MTGPVVAGTPRYPLALGAEEATRLMGASHPRQGLTHPLTGRAMALYRNAREEIVLLEAEGDRIAFGWRAAGAGGGQGADLFVKMLTLRTEQARGWVSEYLGPRGYRLVPATEAVDALH